MKVLKNPTTGKLLCVPNGGLISKMGNSTVIVEGNDLVLPDSWSINEEDNTVSLELGTRIEDNTIVF